MQITSETYKARDQFRFAGQLDALQGIPANYGCHFGMRSTRNAAMVEYYAGYHELDAIFTKANHGADQ